MARNIFLVLKQMSHAHQPLAEVRVHPGVDKRDSPVVDTFVEKFDATSAFRQHEIRRHRRTIVEEEFANHVASVA